MSERKQKGVKIRANEYNQVQMILDARDKNRFDQEGDYVAFAVRQASSVHEGDSYHLTTTCADVGLIHDGVFYICARGGAHRKGAKVKKPIRFKVGKEPMSFEGVKAICGGCHYAGKGLQEDAWKQICGSSKLIKEGSTLVCIAGFPRWEDIKDGARPYPFVFDKEPMAPDTVRRICNAACGHTQSEGHVV